MSSGLRPVDLLVALYNLVLLLVWHAIPGVIWYAPWLMAAHAAALSLPWLFDRWEQSPSRSRLIFALREIYPLLLLLAFWTELGLLQAAAPGEAHDAVVARLDLALFGRHLNLIWMPAMPQLGVSELLHFCYFVYYPLIFVPPSVAGLSGRHAALRDMTLRLMVTYLGCYLVYLAFPVIGPAELMPHYKGGLTQGLFYRLTHAARDAGDSLGTAFPSSHAAGAVTSALLAWRWFPRWVAGPLIVQTLGVVVATVYTQNHYAVDALAGVVWALALQASAVPALVRLLAPAELPSMVPVLPRPWGLRPAAVTGGGA
jgi:membrane-associated phospholipid phosphatase